MTIGAVEQTGASSPLLAVALVILAAVLAAITMASGYLIKQQQSAGRATRTQLANIQRTLDILETGAGAGAWPAIAGLRTDLDKLAGELDELRERHNLTTSSVATLVERLAGLRDQVAEINASARAGSAPRRS